MTTPADKQTDLLQRLAALLEDLREAGGQDGEAMAMLGTLAGDLARAHDRPSWSAAKATMTRQTYEELLEKFRTSGNEHVAAGRVRNAYAIQALALSLVAATQRGNAQIAEGERLLDAIIDQTVATYLRLSPRAN